MLSPSIEAWGDREPGVDSWTCSDLIGNNEIAELTFPCSASRVTFSVRCRRVHVDGSTSGVDAGRMRLTYVQLRMKRGTMKRLCELLGQTVPITATGLQG